MTAARHVLAAADQELAASDAVHVTCVVERRRVGRPNGRRAIDQCSINKPANAWSTAQMAFCIGMSAGFVQSEIICGELKASLFGGSYRIAATEVRRYLEAKGFPVPPWMLGPDR